MVSSRTVSWIENLATQENEIVQGERVSIDIGSAKDRLLESETLLFNRSLLCSFRELCASLNRRLPPEASPIRVKRVADSGEEFSVERIPLQLLFRCQVGVIQFVCDKAGELQFSGSIEARFSAFYELDWLFLGSKVSAEQVARHYLTELLQLTSSR